MPIRPKNSPRPKLNPRVHFSDYLDPSGHFGALKTTIRATYNLFTFNNENLIPTRHRRVPIKFPKLSN